MKTGFSHYKKITSSTLAYESAQKDKASTDLGGMPTLNSLNPMTNFSQSFSLQEGDTLSRGGVLESIQKTDHFDSCHDLVQYKQLQLKTEIDNYFKVTDTGQRFHIPQPWQKREKKRELPSGYETFSKANIISPLHFQHQKITEEEEVNGLKIVNPSNLLKRKEEEEKTINQTLIRKAAGGVNTKSGAHGLFKRFNYPSKSTSPGPGTYGLYPRIKPNRHVPPERRDRSQERYISSQFKKQNSSLHGANATLYNPNYAKFLKGHSSQPSHSFQRESREKRSVSNKIKEQYSPGPADYFQDSTPILQKPLFGMLERSKQRPTTLPGQPRNTIGPGHYDIDHKSPHLLKRQNGTAGGSPYFSKTREKVFSRNKSITRMHQSPKNKTVAVLLNAIEPQDAYSALKQKTKFQKFSKIDRFFPDPRLTTPNVSQSRDSTDMKREINYRPMIHRPDAKIMQNLEHKDYVLQHLNQVKNLNPQGLFMKRKFSSLKHRLKLKQAQEQHQRIFELKKHKLVQNWEHKIIKTNSIVPPSQGVKLLQNWSGIGAISGLMSHIGKLYKRRKAVRQRVRHWITMLYNISKLIGKFKRRVYHAHQRRAMFRILVFVKIHCKRWLKNRRARHVNHIVNFCRQQQRAPYLVHLMNRFLERVRFIQKWLRRITTRFSIRTAIMNLQWSNIESDITGSQKAKSPRLLKTTSGAGLSSQNSERSMMECPLPYNRENSTHEVVSHSPSLQMSTLVPLRVRLLYIRPILWVRLVLEQKQQRKYSLAKRKWLEQTKKLQEQHTLKLSKLNSQRLMMGQAPIRQKFVPSEQPRLRLFIDKDWMVEMVKDALANRGHWSNNKSFKPDLQKLLKKSLIRKSTSRNSILKSPILKRHSNRKQSDRFSTYGLEN